MIQRVVAAHLQSYVRHKRAAWLVSGAVAVGVFVFWLLLFGLVAAVVIEALVVGLSLTQWMVARRRLANR